MPKDDTPRRTPPKHWPAGQFPAVRLRRNRSHDWIRRLVSENAVSVNDLIWPLFVKEGKGSEPITALPGVNRLGLDQLQASALRAEALGIPAIALFPFVPQAQKTQTCEEAYNPYNLVCRAVRAVKAAAPGLGVICDVALDPYNALGHDGLVVNGKVLNDETLVILCRQALVQAEAGCDVIAPSDMMDGRVGAIRKALDDAEFADTKICSYAAKYASAFYGPFRDAVGSGGNLTGDKKTYQMDPANVDEALREVALDLQEGADMVMVKPGLPYLDVIRAVKDNFGVPTFAYQVSGEYAMIKAAAAAGWLDGKAGLMESLVSFKRAGADAILTYAAVEAAEIILQD